VNGYLLLQSEELPGVSLRSATASDCETLRTWKNEHRRAFFLQDTITEDAQRQWFDAYSRRPDDAMFMVQAERETVGCIGIRQRDGQFDVYNVILGQPKFGGQGVMSRALQILVSDARRQSAGDIVARVLTDNPALVWYQKRGFEIVSEFDSYVVVRLADARFTPVSVVRRESS